MYRVHVICRGPEDGGLVWKNVRIRTKTAQGRLEKPERGFVKASAFDDGEKPDILLYVIDTLRADHMGSYGYERDTTPEIDAFAAENARYQNAYATSSWTKPSGASILSGLLPRNHRTATRTAKLPDEVVTLGEILQAQGYYTAAFITNGALSESFGFPQGFDEFNRYPENFETKKIHARAANVNQKVFAFLDKYLQQAERKPLFLLFWSTEPHDPYTPPEEFQNLFEIERFTPIDTPLKLLADIRHNGLEPSASQIEYIKTRYDQEIYSNDRAFGELVERLKGLGLYDKMMLILTADHGEEFFEHGGVGNGLTLYNEQIRIPLIVKSPLIAPGVYDELVQLTDIYPTILDALVLEEPYALDGISLIHPRPGHPALYAEQELVGNDLTARLDTHKKVILNRQYFRPPLDPVMPVFEVYAADDAEEQQWLKMRGFEDYFRLQELTNYSTTPGGLGFQQRETELSPELDRKLRDLGYVK
jgi:arylsulfatase A-like enzyme